MDLKLEGCPFRKTSCIKKECNLYRKDEDQCAIVFVAETLYYIHRIVDYIEKEVRR